MAVKLRLSNVSAMKVQKDMEQRNGIHVYGG
jgi:hypothetical protein